MTIEAENKKFFHNYVNYVNYTINYHVKSMLSYENYCKIGIGDWKTIPVFLYYQLHFQRNKLVNTNNYCIVLHNLQ